MGNLTLCRAAGHLVPDSLDVKHKERHDGTKCKYRRKSEADSRDHP